MDELALRPPTASDVEECGRIVYEAFDGVADLRSFPADFESVEAATGLIEAWVGHPSIFGVVAERDGRIVGSNFLDERDPIRGVGPITVDPATQARGVGRRLMEAVIDRGGDAAGVRLLQDAHNPVSMSLYASLGFEVREPIVRIGGRAGGKPATNHEVRPLEESDLEDCERLCTDVHGFPRTGALRDRHAHARSLRSRSGRTSDGVRLVGQLLATRPGRRRDRGRHDCPPPRRSGGEPRADRPPAPHPSRKPVSVVSGPGTAGGQADDVDDGWRLSREPRGAWFPSVLY